MTKQNYEKIQKQLVALTRDLILIPTTVSRPAEIARGFQLIKNHLEYLEKVQIHEYAQNDSPSLVALPHGCKEPEILLCAHLDVIDYPCISTFQSKIQDSRIYGPGAGDMKGALAITLEIFRFFHMAHPGISLGVAITSDEEIGGESGMGYLFGKGGLRCGLAMVPDGGALNQVTTHEKGILHLKLTCAGRSSHAARPWLGENALLNLIRNIYKLEKLFDELKLDENHWHPTFSPNIIESPNKTFNRVPARAEGVIDIRFPPPHSSSEMLERIKEVLDDNVKSEIIIRAEPSTLNPDPLYYKIAEKVIGQNIEEVRDHGGSDARYIAERNMPVIISRPTVGNLHAEDEWIDIESMTQFYRIYEKYISKKLLS